MILFALQGLWNFIPKSAFAILAAVMGCFLIAASIQNAGLKGKVRRGEIIIGNLQVDLRQCRDNRQTLTDALTRQNAAVEALKADDARRAREAERALSEARRATAAANRRVGSIMAARPGPDACESADRLIMETVR